MATTATQVLTGGLAYRIDGAQKKTITDVLMDTSYPTGGEIITAASLGFSSVCHDAIAQVQTAAVGDSDFANVSANVQSDGTVKLKAHLATGAELTAAQDISGTTIRVTAWGV